MGPKTNSLIEVLDSLVKLLEQDGEDHWSTMIRNIRLRLLSSDFSGIDELLRMYGGMGSFNDHFLGQSIVNGKFQWKSGAKELNEQLDMYRVRAFEIADEIRRDFDSTAV